MRPAASRRRNAAGPGAAGSRRRALTSAGVVFLEGNGEGSGSVFASPPNDLHPDLRHGRYVTSQLAEVAIPRALFAEILRLIDRLRPAPLPP